MHASSSPFRYRSLLHVSATRVLIGMMPLFSAQRTAQSYDLHC